MATLKYGTWEFKIHGRPRIFDGATECRLECQALVNKTTDWSTLQEATLDYDVDNIELSLDEGASPVVWQFYRKEYTKHSRFEFQKVGSEFDIGDGQGILSVQINVTLQKAAPTVDTNIFRRDGIITLNRESNELPGITVSAEYTAAGIGNPSSTNAYEAANNDIESYAIATIIDLLGDDENIDQWKLVRRNVEQLQYNYQKAFATVEFRKQLIADAVGGIYTPQFTGVTAILTKLTSNPQRSTYFKLHDSGLPVPDVETAASFPQGNFAIPNNEFPEIESEELTAASDVKAFFQSEIRYSVMLNIDTYNKDNIKDSYEAIIRPFLVDNIQTTLNATNIYIIKDNWEFDEVLNKFSVILTVEYVTSNNPYIDYQTNYRINFQRATTEDLTENRLVVSSTGYITMLTTTYQISRLDLEPKAPPRLDEQKYFLKDDSYDITQRRAGAGNTNEKVTYLLNVTRTYYVLT